MAEATVLEAVQDRFDTDIPYQKLIMFRSSSVVERSAVNRIVAGPIPASGATRFAEVAQSGRARV